MRIISWNVNGIRAIEKKGFISWLAETNPDILCINETKAEKGQLSPEILNPKAGIESYYSYWASAQKKGYSGVAIYTKIEPKNIRYLGNDKFDNEGRVLIADYCLKDMQNNNIDLCLIAAYFPNSQDGGKRLDYKLAFCDEIFKLCKSIVKKGGHFLLCGDYNIAHTSIDLAHPKANEKNAGYLPEERSWMEKFTTEKICGKTLAIDTFRHQHPKESGHYTWWSYMGGARAKNIGWRIDYHCVDEELLSYVKTSVITPEVFGSDHCPIKIELNLEFN